MGGMHRLCIHWQKHTTAQSGRNDWIKFHLGNWYKNFERLIELLLIVFLWNGSGLYRATNEENASYVMVVSGLCADEKNTQGEGAPHSRNLGCFKVWIITRLPLWLRFRAPSEELDFVTAIKVEEVKALLSFSSPLFFWYLYLHLTFRAVFFPRYS